MKNSNAENVSLMVKIQRSAERSTYAVRKYLSVFTVMIFGFSMYAAIKAEAAATIEQFDTRINTLGIIASILFYICVVLIATSQRNVFWITYKDKNRPLDERLIAVRRKVFERSYYITSFLAIFIFTIPPILVRGELVTILSHGHFMPGIANILFFIYIMPSLVAIWTKDAWLKPEFEDK